MTVLPPEYTTDAVPDVRTSDEEQQPPGEVQAEEMLRGVEEKANSGKDQGSSPKPGTSKEPGTSRGHGNSSGNPRKSKNASKGPGAAFRGYENFDSARKGTHTEVNVFNISGSSGFHVGHKYEIHNNFVAGTYKRPSERPDEQPKNRDVSPHAELPRKLFNSLDTITKEDCAHIGEDTSCKWRELGELLFHEEASRLEQYKTELDSKPRKKGVQSILEEWMKFAGRNAMVARLSRELLKLNEIVALKKLAKRHKLQ